MSILSDIDIKRIPLKRTILTLLTATALFACSKQGDLTNTTTEQPCIQQNDDPAGRSYSTDSVIAFTCTSSYCGLLPLSAKNYWVYLDSIYQDGVFVKTQLDTLRFSNTWKSLPDGIVWWGTNKSVGLPAVICSNDSAIFLVSDRFFTEGFKDARKEYSLFAGDSAKYLTSFDDAAAAGRSLKINNEVKTPAGQFTECIWFEKNARNYRKDQLYFKPGIGVLKYIQEKAPMGTFIIRMQQISTLVSYHIE